MSTTRQRVESRIAEAIEGARVEVRDMTGSDDHLEAWVVSPAFEGKSLVERHKMVYAPLRDWIDDDTIHALSVRALTPAQYESLQRAR